MIIGRDVQTGLQAGARARPGQSGKGPNRRSSNLARLESPGHGLRVPAAAARWPSPLGGPAPICSSI